MRERYIYIYIRAWNSFRLARANHGMDDYLAIELYARFARSIEQYHFITLFDRGHCIRYQINRYLPLLSGFVPSSQKSEFSGDTLWVRIILKEARSMEGTFKP